MAGEVAEDPAGEVAEDPVKVLYIAGAGRSGSTVLDRVLGRVEGFLSVGELRYVWSRGLTEDRLCGCGLRFRACPFWHDVLDQAFGGAEKARPEEALAVERRIGRVRHLPALVLDAARGKEAGPGLGAYPERLGRLYQALRRVSGCRVIVDSSKLPSYGRLLACLPAVDLHVVHLVRDPRATAHSWTRAKEQPDRGSWGLMERRSPLKTALLWDVWNGAALALFRRPPDRYLRLRYEDFVARPEEACGRVLEMVGHRGDGPPFLEGHRIVLEPNHSVAGNPDRLRSGVVSIQADVEWLDALPAPSRAAVTALTAPLLRGFGYPLRVRRSPGPVG